MAVGRYSLRPACTCALQHSRKGRQTREDSGVCTRHLHSLCGLFVILQSGSVFQHTTCCILRRSQLEHLRGSWLPIQHLPLGDRSASMCKCSADSQLSLGVTALLVPLLVACGRCMARGALEVLAVLVVSILCNFVGGMLGCIATSVVLRLPSIQGALGRVTVVTNVSYNSYWALLGQCDAVRLKWVGHTKGPAGWLLCMREVSAAWTVCTERAVVIQSQQCCHRPYTSSRQTGVC
jgi:hypothetical protein